MRQWDTIKRTPVCQTDITFKLKATTEYSRYEMFEIYIITKMKMAIKENKVFEDWFWGSYWDKSSKRITRQSHMDMI